MGTLEKLPRQFHVIWMLRTPSRQPRVLKETNSFVGAVLHASTMAELYADSGLTGDIEIIDQSKPKNASDKMLGYWHVYPKPCGE